ncbi:MAG: M1 family metallopeptidase [Anaerolineales bacterium]|nr:M1 family metallopeptidase [Anaerolineales bacterium]
MKRFWIGLIVLLVWIVGCAGEGEQATAVPTNTPVIPTQTPTNTPTALTPITPTPDLTAPTLFGTAWDDREPFRTGLIPAEQEALDGLPGATIYHITLRISEGLDSVIGAEELRYTNQEDVTLDEVQFHLYPNLLGGELAVPSVFVNQQPTQPAYSGPNNSVMHLPLPEPLSPGETAVIHLNFTTTIPTDTTRNYGVLAASEGILALAHFYPMVAVYDDGWHTETPAPYGDLTYSDSAFFLVSIRAPADVVLTASGSAIDEQTSDDSQLITVAAGPVRDFYVAASRDYVVASRQVGETLINSYAPSQFVEGGTAVLNHAAAALEVYSSRFGTYPFSELDIVSTNTSALGIEYPGIIADALRIYDLAGSSGSLPNTIRLESTTAHEVGHQWFYSMVGNDQLTEPWLDESLTQYAVYLYYLDTGGPQAAASFYSYLEGYWNAAEERNTPIGLPVAAYDEGAYGSIVYGRGPIFMYQLTQAMGEAPFAAFLQAYVSQFKWGIAHGTDFQSLAEQQCQCDLDALFAKWVGN